MRGSTEGMTEGWIFWIPFLVDVTKSNFLHHQTLLDTFSIPISFLYSVLF